MHIRLKTKWRRSNRSLDDEHIQLLECGQRTKDVVKEVKALIDRNLTPQENLYMTNYLEIAHEKMNKIKSPSIALNSPEYMKKQFKFMMLMLPVYIGAVIWITYEMSLYSFPSILCLTVAIGALGLGVVATHGKRIVRPDFDPAKEWIIGVPMFGIMKLFSSQLWVTSLIFSLVLWAIQN